MNVSSLNPSEIASRLREMDVSGPYASQIANNRRTPSQALAIKIFRQTGLRYGCTIGATEDEISALERVLGRQAG